MQYDFDKKETAAKLAQEQKDAEGRRTKNLQYLVIAILGVVVLAVVIIAFIQWRNSKQKFRANILLQQQKEKVESTLSELKLTQAQLIQSEKMASLGELTAGIAHEIQNPLNFINNFSEVNTELIDELQNELNAGNAPQAFEISNDIKKNEHKINHHGKRADSIVKGMLQHSRASTGQKEPADINALADEYLRISYFGFRAKDKSFNAILKTDFDRRLDKIDIVSQDIERVFLNLFNNAFYSVNEKNKKLGKDFEPLVSVSTGKINDYVEVRVKDNGTGIPQNLLEKIYQPFFTTKPTGQGTGLGLSLTYDIVTKEHGGTIKVNTKEGEFAEFVIQLPIGATEKT
jgi:two-component system NtrC family sensor kinase